MRRFESIGEFYRFRDQPPPRHPLISVLDVGKVTHLHPDEPESLTFDFYSIGIKRVANVRMRYGQEPYGQGAGIMSFVAPGQVIRLAIDRAQEIRQSGWVIYVHPDLLWGTPLAETIRQYDYWDYAANEALHVSDKEEERINELVRSIREESEATGDRFSSKILLSEFGSLLSYAERFYHRQFVSSERTDPAVLTRLEALLRNYFADGNLVARGLPTVKYVSGELHLSPKYLSGLLTALTGHSTQQHIHHTLIERAKEKLSTTDRSVSEIAYELGFEHLQSFSKLFKKKTQLSPSEFRQPFR
ncbi:MAG: helix-turn-helix transcriptional regulator [Lewinella sp.]